MAGGSLYGWKPCGSCHALRRCASRASGSVGTRSWLPAHPSVLFCSEKLEPRDPAHHKRVKTLCVIPRRGCALVCATVVFSSRGASTLVGFQTAVVRMYACPTSTEGIRGRRIDSPASPAAAHRRARARGPGIQVSTPPLAVVVTSQLTLGTTAHEAGGWPGVLYGHSFTRPRVGSAATSRRLYSQARQQRKRKQGEVLS